jgi:uncharacterized LabA/DUF88 family protein
LSKNVALFVDVANLYYSARGQDVDVDYVALLKYATKGRDLVRAYAYSGLDPENENQRKFIDFLGKNGYKVVHKDIRKFGDGRMKANLDIELVVDLFRLAHRMDIAVIVSGDGDFAPAMRALQEGGVRCEVISFRPNTSSDLIAVADEFTDIMKIASIERSKEARGMSTPEMPAKEVNPEFGFREASAGVAAAAIAAIRGGDKTPAGRTRRTRAPRAKDEPASEPVEEAVAPPVDANATVSADGDGSRRRRRRRGGRGRGRGRRADGETVVAGEASAATSATGEGDVSWQEFDDLSQLGELTDLGDTGEEREYGFSEADAETLAELGLAPAAPESEPAPTASGRTRGRRTRAASADAASAVEAAGASGPDGNPASAAIPADSPTTRRRRPTSRSSKPAADAAQPAEAGGGTTGEPASAPSGPRSPSRRAPRSRASSGRAGTEAASRAPRGKAAAGTTTQGGSTEAAEPVRDSAPGGAARRSSGRRSSSAAAARASGDDPADAPEGIWQRFKSGRRTKEGD